MEFLSSGGTLEEGSEFDGYSPSELAQTVKALWARQEERPIPEDIPWPEFAPEKVMLRFRDELNRLQPRIEALYADRGTKTADWPRLYFLPVEDWLRYFDSHPGADRFEPGPARDEWIAQQTMYMSALCPWRYSQGVYRFSPSFAKALCASSLKGDIPCEVFLRLPQWSIYVEMPKMRHENAIVIGFWAHLQNADPSMTKPELKLLLNAVDDEGQLFLIPYLIPLEPVTLEECTRRRFESWLVNLLSGEDEAVLQVRSEDHVALYRSEEVRQAFYEHNIRLLRPVLAMLLYLCTTEPDIVSSRVPGARPVNNEGRHLKKGFRLFPAAGPHVWNVGTSMEKDMAYHYRCLADTAKLAGPKEKRREVRSHVRSAHWHGYWKGHRPKEMEKDMREFIFHWIPPLMVRGSRDIEREEKAKAAG